MTLGLRKRGFSMDDLVVWAWIIQGSNEERAERFLSSPSRKPTFILLDILRHDIQHVATFRSILHYTWTKLFSVNPQYSRSSSAEVLESLLEEERNDLISLSLPGMEGTTFKLLFWRLLYQARRLLPSAIFPISTIVPPYFFHSLNAGSMTDVLEPRQHSRGSKLLNEFLHVLSLPSRLEPFKSMVHHWRAQRVLLSLANRTNPPLIINRLGYQSVQAVLLASQKTEEESRLAKLQTRDWPPWRVDQDGMDARRSPDEGVSRVALAIRQMKQAGYSSSNYTRSFSILGGLEEDGTPTIHTRTMSKAHTRKLSSLVKLSPLNAKVWSARIKATRDVQEAWSAFRNFRYQGGTLTPSVYLAMMEKIEAESKRNGRTRLEIVSPGEGIEVLPPNCDNFSDFYKEELRPPASIDFLYEMMISSGIKPGSECLRFLVKHARGIPDGLKYLCQSSQRDDFLGYLIGHNLNPPADFTSAEHRIVHAFIILLCRCADKIAPRPPSDSDSESSAFADLNRLYDSSLDVIDNMNADVIMPQTLPRSKTSGINPLSHTLELIRTSQTKFRPTWYAVFDLLARPGTIIDPDIVGSPRDDINSWTITVAILRDFHDVGLELDPKGFLSICRCLEKALLASFQMDEESPLIDAIHIVKEEFAKLSAESKHSFGLPEISRNLHGAILHAYIRVLGLAEDFDSIEVVVKWMVRHHKYLLTQAQWSRNGHELLRRTLVAAKVFLDGTAYEKESQELVESVESWSWPTDEDARIYTEGGPPLKSVESPVVASADIY